MKHDVVKGSGSIAKDLGLPDPEESDIKANMVARLSTIIQERGLSQSEVARIVGTDQAKISSVLNGRHRGFSIFRLMSYLRALDQDVDIVVRPKSAPEAHVRVVGA